MVEDMFRAGEDSESERDKAEIVKEMNWKGEVLKK